LPANSTVSWSVTSGTGTANLSCTNCAQTTLSKVTTGLIALNASVIDACGNTSILLTKNISVGFAPITLNSTQTGSCNGLYQTWALSANPAVNASNWHWSVDYLGSNADIYIYQPNASSTFADVKGGGTIKLTYTDVCGNNKSNSATVYSTCHSFASISFDVNPNPAQNNVAVSIVKSSGNQTLSKGNVQNLIYAIRISDNLGTLRKSLEFKSGTISTNVSLAGLNPGVYLISVFDGQSWSSKQLVIQ
jgi:hypothetical protein